MSCKDATRLHPKSYEKYRSTKSHILVSFDLEQSCLFILVFNLSNRENGGSADYRPTVFLRVNCSLSFVSHLQLRSLNICGMYMHILTLITPVIVRAWEKYRKLNLPVTGFSGDFLRMKFRGSIPKSLVNP